ncbi:MAG: hypothetical protein HY674_05100, partial [Chloroflexi bacterium]|nr:hypothetical protein [Chloroflexota bacterium]
MLAEFSGARTFLSASAGGSTPADKNVRAPVLARAGLPSGEVEQLSCDREGRVWVEADGRLHRFRGDRWDSPDEAVRLGGRWPVLVPARPSGLWVAD